VSPLQYSTYDCGQIRQELMRVASRVNAVSGAQRSQARNDSIAMGVGLVVFWPALFFLAGGDKKDELSQLKGEYDALNVAAIEKKCGMVTTEARPEPAAAPIVAAVSAPAAAPVVPISAPAALTVQATPAPLPPSPAKQCGMIRQRSGAIKLVPC
jgi:hypothetical protein